MQTLLENFDQNQIPQDLKDNALWCQWKYIYSKYDKKLKKFIELKKPTKVPINPITGEYAKSSDPNTFADFNSASKAMLNGACGMGLGIFKGYSAVDIDDCVDEEGNISEMAQDIIDTLGSYTELSPSNHGLRIIFQTDYMIDTKTHFIHNAPLGLEIYISGSTKKFLTITGHALNDFPVRKIDISGVADKYMKRPEIQREYKSKFSNIEASDLTPGEFKRFLRKDPKLNSAWYALAPGHGADENQRDSRLITKLCFYLGKDKEKVNKMFMSSPYYESKDDEHKQKWAVREDYRENTMERAFALVNEVYSKDHYKNSRKDKNSGLGLEVSYFKEDNVYKAVSDKADQWITLIFKKNKEPEPDQCDIILTKAHLTTIKSGIAIKVDKYLIK